MKRVLAVAALAVAAAPLLSAAPASAATPAACLSVNIDVNGTGQAQTICLPPSGSLF
jgi:hypothetical protein